MQVYVDIIPIILLYVGLTAIGVIITTLVLAYYFVMKRKVRMSYAIMSVFRDVVTVIIVNIVFGFLAIMAYVLRDQLAIVYGPGMGESIVVICITVIIIFAILWLWFRRKQRRGAKFYWREGGMKYSPWG